MIAPTPTELSITLNAMATSVTLRVISAGPRAGEAVVNAMTAIDRVEAACTRFDPKSALMRANAAGTAWHRVPLECYLALAEAAQAHLETGGLFDPRVLDTLVALGYDRTLPFRTELISVRGPGAPARPSRGVWRPGLNAGTLSVRLGTDRIDLGGIGKGLAVRLAAQALDGAGRGFLVEAGGDCVMRGEGPDGGDWQVGVEDPFGATEPVAVLRVAAGACATSSLRIRSWQVDGRLVHHLIDPRTGDSAASGLRSVTVLHDDPVQAEVWSKALLIAGRSGIAELAAERGLAALWVDDDARITASAPMAPSVLWQATDG